MNPARGIARRIELLVDVVLTSLVYLVVYTIKRDLLPSPFAGLTTTPDYLLLLLLIIIIWYGTLDLIRIKYRYGAKLTGAMFMDLFKGVTISTIILVLFMYIMKITDVSRLLIFLFYVTDLAVLTLARWMTRQLISSKRRDDYSRRYVLILGSRTAAKELIRMVVSEEDSNIRIVGCIELHRADVGKTVCCGVQIIGTLEDLRDILLNQIVDEVLIAMPLNEITNSEWYLSFISTFGVTVRIIPYWYIRKFMSKHAAHVFAVEQFLSEPAFIISKARERRDALLIKALMDYAMAVFALFLTFPLFLIIPCLIKYFSPGPVYYKQTRCGQDGRKFPLFKFRTMVPDAEQKQASLLALNEASGPAFKIKKDPRIIPYIGTFLRKVSLDELPQFINVIRGEMSFVGPRPPTPSEVEKYELWQRRRLSMKPGITCIWQIQPRRNEIPFDRWMDMDMDYIDHWSLWLDIVIILKTVPAILFGRGQ